MADTEVRESPPPAAPATLRAYRADWNHYAAWCAGAGVSPMPAAGEQVAAYLDSLAQSHAPATMRRRLAALARLHRYNDMPWDSAHPAIQARLRALPPPSSRARRAILSRAQLAQLIATCDASARGRRDRALLAVGFAAALRRSQLVALQAEDVTATAGGLALRVRRSVAGDWADVAVPRGEDVQLCPVRSLAAWQEIARRQAGPLFRRIHANGGLGDAALHPDAVRRILAYRCRVAGLESTPSADALRTGGRADARG